MLDKRMFCVRLLLFKRIHGKVIGRKKLCVDVAFCLQKREEKAGNPLNLFF